MAFPIGTSPSTERAIRVAAHGRMAESQAAWRCCDEKTAAEVEVEGNAGGQHASGAEDDHAAATCGEKQAAGIRAVGAHVNHTPRRNPREPAWACSLARSRVWRFRSKCSAPRSSYERIALDELRIRQSRLQRRSCVPNRVRRTPALLRRYRRGLQTARTLTAADPSIRHRRPPRWRSVTLPRPSR